MKLIIICNGKEYVVCPLPKDGHVDPVVERHPGFIFFADAESEEQAAIKIQRDKDRRKAEWI